MECEQMLIFMFVVSVISPIYCRYCLVVSLSMKVV